MVKDSPGSQAPISVRIGAVAGYALLAAVGYGMFRSSEALGPISFASVATRLGSSTLSTGRQAATLYAVFDLVPLIALLGVYFLTRETQSSMVRIGRVIALVVCLEFMPSREVVQRAAPAAVAAMVNRLVSTSLLVLAVALAVWLAYVIVRWLVRDELAARGAR